MATSSPSQSGRSMRHNIITVIIACLVGLALMEGGVRIWAYRIAKPEVASVIVGTGPADERGRFVRHPYLNYTLRPNYVSADGQDRHNAQGMHDGQPVVVPKPAGQYRIVAIGGSTTYGVGMRRSEDA